VRVQHFLLLHMFFVVLTCGVRGCGVQLQINITAQDSSLTAAANTTIMSSARMTGATLSAQDGLSFVRG
jgi:hypothetical protein